MVVAEEGVRVDRVVVERGEDGGGVVCWGFGGLEEWMEVGVGWVVHILIEV